MKLYFTKENIALLKELVRTDFKLRYQGSVVGYAWSLLRPFMMFLILYLVFVKFLKLGNDIPHYPVYLLLGIVMWNFFSESTQQGLGSIVGRGDLIRKIRIPRWIIIFSSSISALINLFMNLVVISIFLYLSKVDLSWSIMWLPLIFLELYIMALGVSLFLSANFVKYRDVIYVWEVLLQAGFYLTPILYPLSKISNLTFEKILLLNPVAQTIQDARYVTITKTTTTVHSIFNGGWYALIPFIFVSVILLTGLLYFKSQSKYFAENI
jgi:ABC-2 type transport system permease protein